MKEYETITREKVDVVPFGCGMPETHLMQDWSDRMLDLILNGPTINGIKKDEVRAMLRETYAALKQYEKIGPMASPFINDPTAIVARAFSELYPGIEYVAQYVPDLRDETKAKNKTAAGYFLCRRSEATKLLEKAKTEAAEILKELKAFYTGDIGITAYINRHVIGCSVAGDLTINGEICRSYDPIDLCFLELNELMMKRLIESRKEDDPNGKG